MVVQWDLHAVLLCFTIQPVYHETTAIPFSAFYAADLFSHVAWLGVVTNRGLVLIDKILSPKQHCIALLTLVQETDKEVLLFLVYPVELTAVDHE